MTFQSKPVTELPARLEPMGEIGWGVFVFETAKDAADFFVRRANCAMPCWKRMEIVNGELMLVKP